ncbi:sodium-dependent transporter, partial [candidate division KSB1 bacterium]
IGAGNIWRFPRLVAQNGGSAFLIPWLIFLFLWSIPLLMVEFAIGKTTRLGTIGAFGKFMGRKFTWMGCFVGFCTMGIMFYYSVVTGWSLHYFLRAGSGQLLGIDYSAYWNQFTGSGYLPLLFHLLAISTGIYIVYHGVVAGIERANKLLIPSLFLLIIIAAIRALLLPNAVIGLNYLFYPDWAKLLNYRVWLEGLSQSAWSTGAGWGLILTYGIYLKEREHIVSNSFITGLGNCSASLIVSLAIIPTVFSILPYQDAMTALRAGNTGFTFVWIPHLFDKMPAGSVFATIFFLALFFAALSSLISMIELTTRIFMDMGMQRRQAIKLVWTIGFLLGVPSAISLSIFNNQDWVWGIGLLLSGFFFAVAVNKFGARNFRLTLLNVEHDIIKVGRWFEWVLKYLIPVEFVALLLWWFYQSIVYYEPNSWWNPFKTYSLGTCLVQWGVVLTIFIIFNRQITRLVLKEKNS